MTGAILACAGATTAGGGGGGSTTITPAPAWGKIFDNYVGQTNTVTIAGIGQPVSITASLTGLASLSYVKNGTVVAYTGGFTVAAGDTLAWQVSYAGRTTGVVTVTNATTALVIATFNYNLSNV